MDEALVYFGGELKALDDKGRVGGYLVRFNTVDLTGERFTAKTYLGAREGDGVDTLFHHGQPLPIDLKGQPTAIKEEIEHFRNYLFAPIKTKRDALGIWAETVLRLSEAYEQEVFGIVKMGKLGWSSGALGHQVIKSADGEILRWIIGEASLTPTPAEKLNRAVPLKSIQSLKFVPLDDAPVDGADDNSNQETIKDAEQQVLALDGLDIDTHSQLTVIAMRGITSRFRGNAEARQKAGRVLSERNRQRITSLIGQGKAVIADLQTLLGESAGATDDAEKRAKQTADLMAKHRYDRR
jgi:hypothetical protein